MVTTDIVVPFELARIRKITFALIPVARSTYAIHQPTVMQHGQIKATAVPGDEYWRQAFQAIKETLDDGAFFQFWRREGKTPLETGIATESTGDADFFKSDSDLERIVELLDKVDKK